MAKTVSPPCQSVQWEMTIDIFNKNITLKMYKHVKRHVDSIYSKNTVDVDWLILYLS